MFKDYDKYLFASTKVYLFVLVIIFIMKLVGLDYFGIDLNNPAFTNISNFLISHKLTDVWYAITMIFYLYMFISISCKDNSKRMKLFILATIPITFLVKYLNNIIKLTSITFFIEFFYMFFLCIIYNKIFKKEKISKVIKRYLLFVLVNTMFQFISSITRVNYISKTDYSFIVNIILDFDYILLLVIFYKIYFEKGDLICSEMAAGLSSLKKINLKKSLQKLLRKFQSSLRSFKKKSKEEKISIVIFITLSLIWNILNVILILFVSFLNDTFIECIFILSSFWLSKGKFGKSFHFDSMAICFIVSNVTYFTLNRLTTPLGISLLYPVLLGVGLSYVTAKFVKKKYNGLFRGMSKESFDDAILKVVELDSDKYKICYDFYINKEKDVSLAFKYNYTVPGIRKIKDRINKKIKEL